jgi:hypothetical protein
MATGVAARGLHDVDLDAANTPATRLIVAAKIHRLHARRYLRTRTNVPAGL